MIASMKRPGLAAALLLACAVSAAAGDNDVAGIAQRGVPSGGDMTLCRLSQLTQFGRVADVVGLAVTTTSLNIGTADLQWFQVPAENHPFIAMNLYRLKDDRFEQIGQSWVKHGFFAVNETVCGAPCTYEPGHGPGDWLGVGCSDTYGAGLNANQGRLGPRYEVNPWTGQWTYAGSHFTQPDTHDAISHRLQVKDADLDPALNPGASYFVEGYYVILDDVNVLNSAGWKPVTVSGAPGGTWTFNMSGLEVSPTTGFALEAWGGSVQTLFAEDNPPIEFVSPDGRSVLAGKATDVGGSFWRYEYALLNIDMDRQVGSFSIPIPPNAVVRNIGFHAVRHHDEPVNEPGGVPIDNNPWTSAVAGGAITWSTTSNPLRWGTLYNFRFEINSPPVVNLPITLGLFKPGIPAQLTAATLGPSGTDADCDGNMIPDFQEIAADPALDCDGNMILDLCDPNCDAVGPPDACVIADCLPGDPSCADCNANAIPDGCDLAAGTSPDCNGNGVPDECEPNDCNANGIPDDCDIMAGVEVDCDGNTIPDSCEIALDPSLDCNNNGLLDACGESDCNANGLPDDCEQPACPGILAGDMDCSGVVDMADLPEFLSFLLSGFPSCRSDMNGDQAVNGRDIALFVSAVLP